MKTSNFTNAGSHPDAVSISIGIPRGWKGRRYVSLAPSWAMLKMTPQDYARRYTAILKKLDPEQVYADLGEDAILLCWEGFNVRCHRRWVAEWLERALGIEIPELGHERSESMAFKDMPGKQKKKPANTQPRLI